MVQNDMIQLANAKLNDDKYTPKMRKKQCYQELICLFVLFEISVAVYQFPHKLCSNTISIWKSSVICLHVQMVLVQWY